MHRVLGLREAVEGTLCLLEVLDATHYVLLCLLEVMRCVLLCVLLCILDAVKGALCLLEVLSTMEVPEVMRCVAVFAIRSATK